MPYWRRLAVFAAAVVSIDLGLVCLGVWATARPLFGDGQMILDAGSDLVAGRALYGHSLFLYPPLAAVLGIGLAAVPGWLLIEAVLRLLVVALGAWVVTAGHDRRARLLTVVVAVTCVPVVQDLIYGNENVWLAAAVALIVWRTDTKWSGVPLGLLLALFAKPQLAVFLLWMVMWRRRAFVATIVTATVATAAGVILAGASTYDAWLRHDLGQYQTLSAPFTGNQGLQAMVGPAWPLVFVVLMLALGLALWRLDEPRALVWALATGVLVLPYVGAYSLVPLLPAARQLARTGPIAGLLAPLLALFAPSIMLLGVLAAQLIGPKRSQYPLVIEADRGGATAQPR